MSEREFDIVLLGATGFAGRLTASYLAGRTQAHQRIALAGRDAGRLDAVLRDVQDGGTVGDFSVVTADSSDPAAMDILARRTRVLATTVGPYVLYGEQPVRACAAAGTDYVDLTGEPEFVDTMFLRYDAIARRTGARLVHACGFDSVPHDLGVLYTVRQLPSDVPIGVRGYVQAAGTVSGGTAHSALLAFSRARSMAAAARARRRTEPRPVSRSSRAVAGQPHRSPLTGGWAVPLPTIDPQIVARSGRADARYGPDFRYSHFASVPRASVAAGLVAGAAGLFGAAQVPPLRRALMRRIPAGTGPDEARRARSWFRVTFVGEAADDRGRADGNTRVVTRVSGGDPGYAETARMFGESALCLAFDEGLADVAGQVTTVEAMGDALLARLERILSFEVLPAP